MHPISKIIIWFFLFYNIERFSQSVDFTDVAYVFMPLSAIVTVLVSRLRKVSLWVILGVTILLFLIVKVWVKSGVLGNSLTLTVTEICFIGVTTMLACWVSDGIGEFERAIANITFGQSDSPVKSFSVSQAEMYRELNRARNHQRPLALLSVGIDKESMLVALDRMVREAQQAMMREYVMSDVARTLCDKLEDYNVIARNHDHFMVLLPEVKSEQLAELRNQLKLVISEQTGVALHIGEASFPEDGTTFEKLVDLAVGRMEKKYEPRPEYVVQSQSLATKQRTM